MMNFTARDLSGWESATGHLKLENAKLGEERANLPGADLGGNKLGIF